MASALCLIHVQYWYFVPYTDAYFQLPMGVQVELVCQPFHVWYIPAQQPLSSSCTCSIVYNCWIVQIQTPVSSNSSMSVCYFHSLCLKHYCNYFACVENVAEQVLCCSETLTVVWKFGAWCTKLATEWTCIVRMISCNVQQCNTYMNISNDILDEWNVVQ